jgi:hypothetical protein
MTAVSPPPPPIDYHRPAVVGKQNLYDEQPTTTMRILSFGGFDGCTQGGADAAKWLKSA